MAFVVIKLIQHQRSLIISVSSSLSSVKHSIYTCFNFWHKYYCLCDNYSTATAKNLFIIARNIRKSIHFFFGSRLLNCVSSASVYGLHTVTSNTQLGIHPTWPLLRRFLLYIFFRLAGKVFCFLLLYPFNSSRYYSAGAAVVADLVMDPTISDYSNQPSFKLVITQNQINDEKKINKNLLEVSDFDYPFAVLLWLLM